ACRPRPRHGAWHPDAIGGPCGGGGLPRSDGRAPDDRAGLYQQTGHSADPHNSSPSGPVGCGQPANPAQVRTTDIAAPLLLILQTPVKPLLVTTARERAPNRHVEARSTHPPPGALVARPRRADSGEARLPPRHPASTF